jgi:hypothetical protein
MPGKAGTLWIIRTIAFAILSGQLLVSVGCDRPKKAPDRKTTRSIVTSHPDVLTCGVETTWTMTLTIPPDGIEEGGQIIVVYNEVFRGDSSGIDHEAHLESQKGATLEEIPFSVPEVNEKLTRRDTGFAKIRLGRYSVFVHYKIVGAPLVAGDRFALTLRGEPFPYPVERWFIPVYIDRRGNDEFDKLPAIHAPRVKIIPGEPAALRIVSPAIVQTGEPFEVRGIVLDQFNNPPLHGYRGEITLSSSDSRARIPGKTLSIGKSDGDNFRFNGVELNTPGLQILTVSGEGLKTCHIPIDCRTEKPHYQLYWGMLHVHTTLSDGMLTPEETYYYGRNTGMLDFFALADHNQRLDEASWQLTINLADRFYLPGRFVTFPGYEWSTMPGTPNRDYRQVYFPGSGNAVLHKKPANEVTSTFLDDRVLIVAQLRSGADWDAPQPYQQRLVEIHTGFATTENTRALFETTYLRYSSTESRREEIRNYGTFQDGLAKGYRIGVIADGDDHSSTPGRCYFDGGGANEPNKMGLAAVYSRELTREEVFNSLYDRHCYGTTGERIFVDFSMDGHRMGREYETASPPEITYRVGSPGEIEQIEIIRDNEIFFTGSGEGNIIVGSTVDNSIEPGTHFYYLRVTLRSGDMAWSSPIWVTKKERINETIR